MDCKEVEGETCDKPYSMCWFWPFVSDPDAYCRESCLKVKDEKYEYYDGQCRPARSALPVPPECFCCVRERSRAETEGI